jgi:hypothetical protein
MTAKEKAKELFEKMFNKIQSDELGLNYLSAKDCALIAVDECLKILNVWSAFNMPKSSEVIFYEEVKQEIKKL